MNQTLSPPEVTVHDVPGAFEIPLFAQRLANAGLCDAVIACGLVVDGSIYRHAELSRPRPSAVLVVAEQRIDHTCANRARLTWW